jgi:hypothetical protein
MVLQGLLAPPFPKHLPEKVLLWFFRRGRLIH